MEQNNIRYDQHNPPTQFRRISKSLSRRPKETIYIGNVDYVLVMAILLLILFGITMIFSSSYYVAAQSDDGMFVYLRKQVIATMVGAVAMVIAANVDYRFWKKFTLIAYVFSNILLIYVMFFGVEKYGARRWISVPIFGTFQPSEFAKVTLILFLAKLISEDKHITRGFTGLLKLGAVIAIPCVLVLLGRNLSTALILAAIGFGVVFVASPHFWPFVLVGVGAVGGLIAYLTIFAAKTGAAYRAGRFAVWKDPFSDPTGLGFQTIQSLYAVASGGLFGLGLGQSRQKLRFMPEPHNDFIFAIICEELGFFGAGIILLLFAILLWRGFRIALQAPDVFGSLIATGAMIMIGVQVIINVGVVTNTIPNTGIPLPFISYGGTSILFLMALMGIVINISRYSKKAN